MATAAGGHAVEASELPTPGQVFERLLLSGSLRTLYFRCGLSASAPLHALRWCRALHRGIAGASLSFEFSVGRLPGPSRLRSLS